MLFTVLLIIHILVCVALIIVVLMQSAKGEGLAGAFGGGGISGAVFGGRGAASFLSRATTVLAIFFMVSCLGLSLLSAGGRAVATDVAESPVTKAAQEDMAQQQATQQAQQEAQGQPAPGTSTLPEDVFDVQPAGQPTDSPK